MPRVRAVVALVVLLSASPLHAEMGAGTVYAPGDDAYVLKSAPGASHPYGSSWLRSGTGFYADEVYRSFVRFPLPRRGRIVSARLVGRYAGSTKYPEQGLHAFDFVPEDGWTPATLTWDNQPDVAERIATVDVVVASEFEDMAFDVTPLVQREQPDGWLSMRIAAVDESARDRSARWNRRGARYARGFHLEIVLDPVPGLAAGDVVALSSGGLHSGIVAIAPDERVLRPLAPIRILDRLGGLAVDPRNGAILSSDANGLVRIDPQTGTPSPASADEESLAGRFFHLAVAPDGDVFATQDAAIVRIDATSGARELVSSGGDLCVPAGIALAADQLFVSDACSLLHVVLHDGSQRPLPVAEPLHAPEGIVLESGGTLLLADGDGAGGGRILRIDPRDGSVATVAALPFAPGPLAVDPAGTIWVGSQPDRYEEGGRPGELGRVDEATGAYTSVWRSPDDLGGLAIGDDGAPLVAASRGGSPRIARIDPASGAEQVIAAPLAWPGDPDWHLFVDADRSLLAVAGERVIRIDPATGRQTTVAAGSALSCPVVDSCISRGVDRAPDGRLAWLRFVIGTAEMYEEVLWLDPATGLTSVQPHPLSAEAFAIERSGALLMAKRGYPPTVLPSIWRVDPSSGLAALLATGGLLGSIDALALDRHGALYVSDAPADRIVRVDSRTGAMQTLASGARLRASRLLIDAAGRTLSWGDVGNQVQLTLFDPATGDRTALATEPELPARQTMALVPPACANGIDDDGDGLVDEADPGCVGPASNSESPACQNGLDDDGDGRVDFDGGASAQGGGPIGLPDPDCPTAHRATERRTACGLGAELALALLLLGRHRRRTAPVLASPGQP